MVCAAESPMILDTRLGKTLPGDQTTSRGSVVPSSGPSINGGLKSKAIWHQVKTSVSQDHPTRKRIYHIFQTIRHPPKIWEEKGGVSYSLNVAYLAHLGVGGAAVELGHRRQEQDHIFYFKICFPIFLL